MRPLAQTFLISEPINGAEAVFVTAIDLFFRSKPATSPLGVEIQIRETINGVPQSSQLPYATKTVAASSIQISADASAATRFTFDTPVLVRTNELFAVAVIPLGGEPDYRLWTAQRDFSDVNGPNIVFPNNIGSLYAPSNDLSYTPIQNQALKFSLVTANFTSSSGSAVFNPDTLEFFSTRPVVGRFAIGERVVISNNNLKLASLTISVATPFTLGEIVVQPNTATNVISATAYGTVYASNNTVTLLRDTVGKFSTSGSGLRGLTSAIVTSNPSAAFANAMANSACTVFTVPTTTTPNSDFTVGNFIYVGSSRLANVQVAKITAVNSVSRQITVDTPIRVEDPDAVYGRVKSDGNLFGFCDFTSFTSTLNVMGLTKSSANSPQNFADSANQILIGVTSGTSAVVDRLENVTYDSLTSQITSIASKSSNASYSFSGYGTGGSADATAHNIFNDAPYEFIDRQRIIYSRSNEITQLSGNRSLNIKIDVSTDNQKFSPYIDRIRRNALVTTNEILSENKLNGYYLSFTSANGAFSPGSIVWQANATTNTSGKVSFSNSTFMSVYDITTSNAAQIALFNANNTSVITGTGGTVANVISTRAFNEALGNGSKTPSRYISKTVVLAEGQDAEDLAVFLTAYRPQGTNIKVYGKILNTADSDPFDDKSWTPMPEATSTALISSLVNRDDYVELRFELPQSVAVHTSNISVNTTSSIINFTNSRTTEAFSPGMFVYVTDTIARTFAVRRVIEVPNTSALVVASNLTFVSTNAAVGYVDSSLAQCNAFRYLNNNGIVRYVCRSTDSVFDGFKTFAIKIVMTSDSAQIVPRIADMRALALQI